MSKKLLENIISYMAYERGHSAGEDEVEAIKKGMMADFKPVFLRIEELEADLHAANEEGQRIAHHAAEVRRENNALLADNERLRDCLLKAIEFVPAGYGIERECWSAISATPEQSLARVRNQVREECAAILDDDDADLYDLEFHAAAIRAMKEPD